MPSSLNKQSLTHRNIYNGIQKSETTSGLDRKTTESFTILKTLQQNKRNRNKENRISSTEPCVQMTRRWSRSKMDRKVLYELVGFMPARVHTIIQAKTGTNRMLKKYEIHVEISSIPLSTQVTVKENNLHYYIGKDWKQNR